MGVSVLNEMAYEISMKVRIYCSINANRFTNDLANTCIISLYVPTGYIDIFI